MKLLILIPKEKEKSKEKINFFHWSEQVNRYLKEVRNQVIQLNKKGKEGALILNKLAVKLDYWLLWYKTLKYILK